MPIPLSVHMALFIILAIHRLSLNQLSDGVIALASQKCTGCFNPGRLAASLHTRHINHSEGHGCWDKQDTNKCEVKCTKDQRGSAEG
jgi:hypothetical protein